MNVDALNAVSETARRGSRVIRNSIRNSALGRVSVKAGFSNSREMRLDEDLPEGDEEKESDSDESSSSSSSHASMSSSSEGELDRTDLGLAGRRGSRHALSTSMVKLNKKGNKAVQWSKILIIAVLVVIACIIIAMTYVMLESEDQEHFEFGVSLPLFYFIAFFYTIFIPWIDNIWFATPGIFPRHYIVSDAECRRRAWGLFNTNNNFHLKMTSVARVKVGHLPVQMCLI